VKQESREKGIRRKGVNLPMEKNPSNWAIKRGVNLLEHDSGPEGDVLAEAILGVLAGFLLFVLAALFKRLWI
jgi:hypothetical protein